MKLKGQPGCLVAHPGLKMDETINEESPEGQLGGLIAQPGEVEVELPQVGVLWPLRRLILHHHPYSTEVGLVQSQALWADNGWLNLQYLCSVCACESARMLKGACGKGRGHAVMEGVQWA
eukprot:1148729-Pelagomonas_calceolata.AAC.2